MHGESDYGLWPLVIINSAIFIFLRLVLQNQKQHWTGAVLVPFLHLLLRCLPRCMAFR